MHIFSFVYRHLGVWFPLPFPRKSRRAGLNLLPPGQAQWDFTGAWVLGMEEGLEKGRLGWKRPTLRASQLAPPPLVSYFLREISPEPCPLPLRVGRGPWGRMRGGWQSPRLGSGMRDTKYGPARPEAEWGGTDGGGVGAGRQGRPQAGGGVIFRFLGTYPQSKGGFTWATPFPPSSEVYWGSEGGRGAASRAEEERPEPGRASAAHSEAWVGWFV